MVNFARMNIEEFKRALISVMERIAEAADQHDIFLPELNVESRNIKVTLKFSRIEKNNNIEKI